MNDSRSNSGFLAWCLIIAAIAHFLFRNLPTSLTDLETAKKENDRKEIIVEPVPEKDRPVVQTNKAEETPENKNNKARFSGEFRNRVDKEMQSRHRGKFQQGGKQAQSGAEGKEGAGPRKGLKLSDLMPYSTSPEDFGKDIPQGDQTMLNTEPVLYASFVNRIKDAVYDKWTGHLQDAVRDYASHRQLESKPYSTTLLVVMNNEGKVTEIRLLESCGVPVIDEAAKKAFWEIEAFRNPPSQMFDKDGFIKLTWKFTLDQSGGFRLFAPL